MWNFTSSVFITVGVADTLCHPQFCRVPTLFRISQEDEAFLRETLAALLGQRNTSALVLAMEARKGPDTGHLLEDLMATFHQPEIIEKLLAVFMTVGDAGTPGTLSSSVPSLSRLTNCMVYHEDEAMLRESLQNLGRILSAERRVHNGVGCRGP